MGAGLSNFTETAVPNEFGHPVVAASLLAPDVTRGARLASLFQYGLEDLERLVPRDLLSELPILIGVAADLTSDEKEALRTVVREHQLEKNTAWYPYGRASTFAALAVAKESIERGTQSFALVAGIDSLCAAATLSSLVRAGRILSPFTEGTIPGEAAAFALLARTDDPIVQPATALRLDTVAVDRAEVPFTKSRAVSADALTAVLRKLRTAGEGRVDRVVAAHSGEGYFGRAFGYASLRELEIMPEPLVVETIADCVGDVGAAAGIVGLAFGAYGMVESASEGPGRVLAYSESDSGEVGAAILAGAPLSWHRHLVQPSSSGA
jgi:3-oxoacyl-[acyl-carrier-protein] synthase-1